MSAAEFVDETGAPRETRQLAAPGLRERKRLETRNRISEVGLRLFAEKGYDATTLDDIATAAEISRRTFFYYFKSKDDVLIALQCEPVIEALGKAFDSVPAGATPFEVLVEKLPEVVGPFGTDRTVAISEIMQTTDTLKVRKLAIYVDMEIALFEALAKVWRGVDDRPKLRLLAAVSIAVLRLSMDQWRIGEGTNRLSDCVRQNFLLLPRLA